MHHTGSSLECTCIGIVNSLDLLMFYIMRRAKRAALSYFFLIFQRKKASSCRIAYEGQLTRVRSLEILSLCNVCVYFVYSMFVCIKFFGHVCPRHSAYTAPRPVPKGPVHAQMTDNSSRTSFAVRRGEFVEIGAATCGFPGTNY